MGFVGEEDLDLLPEAALADLVFDSELKDRCGAEPKAPK